MISHLERLIAGLRDELQQYGEMLALLDREQELVIQRAGPELFETVGGIQLQAAVIQQARARREQDRGTLAQALRQPTDATLTSLLPLIPAHYQPLVDALIRENNQLLVRVQQRARQNHLLLSRSLELMQRFIATLVPSRDTQVYDDHGLRPLHAHPMPARYEAVG